MRLWWRRNSFRRASESDETGYDLRFETPLFIVSGLVAGKVVGERVIMWLANKEWGKAAHAALWHFIKLRASPTYPFHSSAKTHRLKAQLSRHDEALRFARNHCKTRTHNHKNKMKKILQTLVGSRLICILSIILHNQQSNNARSTRL